MQPIIVELTVANVDVSLCWYKKLGFMVELEGLRDGNGLRWVSLVHGGRSVWLRREDMSIYSAETAPRTTLYLQVDNADLIYKHLTGYDIQPESQPQNQWYGLREFALRDPDGFRWVIHQPIPAEECPPFPHQHRGSA